MESRYCTCGKNENSDTNIDLTVFVRRGCTQVRLSAVPKSHNTTLNLYGVLTADFTPEIAEKQLDLKSLNGW